jgi:hypothetical protein
MVPSRKSFQPGRHFRKKNRSKPVSGEYQSCKMQRMGIFVSEVGDSAAKQINTGKISTGRGKGPCLTDAARYATIPGVPFVGLPLCHDPNVSLSGKRRN